MDTFLLSLIIILGIQLLFFMFAAMFKTDKVTDLAYGLTFAILAWIILIRTGTFSLEAIVLTIMITLWGVRLAGYLFYRIMHIGKDKRFDGIRERFWKFAGFWTAQTIVIFIVMLPSIIFLDVDSDIRLTLLGIIGFFIWILGFLIETVSDHQKFKFRNNSKNKDRWIDTGLWRYSRHPNYFGEILCWIGIFVYAIPVLSGWEWASIISPIGIIMTLLFFSGIPTVEKNDDKRYGKDKKYLRYKSTTSVLIPWFKG